MAHSVDLHFRGWRASDCVSYDNVMFMNSEIKVDILPLSSVNIVRGSVIILFK